jgi:hypothetical protein
MEFIAIFLSMVVLFVGYRFWISQHAMDSCQAILEQLRGRIRSGLKVVGVNQLEAIQENLSRLEQQVVSHLPHKKSSEKFSPQLSKSLQAIDDSFVQIEQSWSSTPARNLSIPRSRSIMWNGLRFTLSDAIWSYLGLIPMEDIEDAQVQVMVQGPFCRACLKRLVERYSVPAAEVPKHCRHCGLSWNNQKSDCLPISLVELKRRVFDDLDRKSRASRMVQR